MTNIEGCRPEGTIRIPETDTPRYQLTANFDLGGDTEPVPGKTYSVQVGIAYQGNPDSYTEEPFVYTVELQALQSLSLVAEQEACREVALTPENLHSSTNYTVTRVGTEPWGLQVDYYYANRWIGKISFPEKDLVA